MKNKAVNFRVIFYPFIAFLLGLIVAKRFFAGEIEVVLVTIITLGASFAYFIYHKSIKPIIIILCFFLLGNGFYFLGEKTFQVKDYQGQVSVVGRVTDDIQGGDYYTAIVLDNVSINGEKTKNLRLTVKDTYQEELNVGDVLAFETTVERSKLYYLKEFNSKDYRAGVRYNAEIEYKDIVVKAGHENLDEIVRQDIKTLIYKNMSEENASIAYAVMFGDKSDLDGEIYTSYQQSGIIHVLTVSGLHVGFLVSLFYGLLKKCRVNNIVNLIISTLVLIFYAYLCNFSPSVVRASIMAICMMSARALHRQYDSLNALGLAGFIICIIKPLTALDIGFLMSFFCVFAIVMINPSLTKLFSIIFPEKIASLISLSTSAQLGILPFIAYMGGSINLLSFAINMLVVPMFSLLYPYLFLVCMFGSFMPFLGAMLKLVEIVFTIINKIATFFACSGLIIPLSPMGFAIVVVFFFILFLIGRYLMINPIKKLSLFSACFMSIVFSFCMYTLPINANSFTSISYLNYYGSMSIVLETKSGQIAVVGENNFLERYKNKYDKDDFDIFFDFTHLSDEKVNDLSQLGISRFITCRQSSDQSNCEVVNVNTGYSIGDINFNFITSYDESHQTEEVIGIVFNTDNRKIFIANDAKLSYTKYEYLLKKYSPEIVVAGNNSQLAKGDFYTCITYDDVEGCEYSYQKEGNLQLYYYGNNWIKRGLD